MIWFMIIGGVFLLFIGVIAGLFLFAILERELITKLLLLKAEILYFVKEEFNLFRDDLKEIKPKRKRVNHV